jgi:hypothetical protein
MTVEEIVRADRIEAALQRLIALRDRVSDLPEDLLAVLRTDPEGLLLSLFSGSAWDEADRALTTTPALTTEHLRILRGMQPDGGYSLHALRCHGATQNRMGDLLMAGLVSSMGHWRLTDRGVALRSRIEPSPEVGAEGVFMRDV